MLLLSYPFISTKDYICILLKRDNTTFRDGLLLDIGDYLIKFSNEK